MAKQRSYTRPRALTSVISIDDGWCCSCGKRELDVLEMFQLVVCILHPKTFKK